MSYHLHPTQNEMPGFSVLKPLGTGETRLREALEQAVVQLKGSDPALPQPSLVGWLEEFLERHPPCLPAASHPGQEWMPMEAGLQAWNEEQQMVPRGPSFEALSAGARAARAIGSCWEGFEARDAEDVWKAIFDYLKYPNPEGIEPDDG